MSSQNQVLRSIRGSRALLVASIALAAPLSQDAFAQVPAAASKVGAPQAFQSGLELSPNLSVNLATGNLHVNVLTSRFGNDGRPPFHDLYLHHNSLDAAGLGDRSGGLGLGNGWSSSLGGRLQFPFASSAHLAFPDGTARSLSLVSPSLWRSEIDRELEVAVDAPGWVATDADQWTWHYDATGTLFQVCDPSCNTYSIARSGGVVTSVTDPSGRQATFQATAGKVTSVSDGSGNTWIFTRDAQGRLATVVDPGFGWIGFGYDTRDRITTVTEWSGAAWQFTYFNSGSALDGVQTVLDPAGNTRTFAYVENTEWTATVTDASGAEWTTVHDLQTPRALVSTEDPFGKTWFYQHDVRRHIDQVTSPLGHVWAFSHDVAGNLLTFTDPLAHTWTSTYDALNNRTSSTQSGATFTWQYSDTANPTSITAILAPAASGPLPTTTYAWHGPLDGAPAGSWKGCLESLTDPLGASTRFAYDALGTCITVEEGPAAATGRVERTWDTVGTTPFTDHGSMPPSPTAPSVPPLPTQVAGRMGTSGNGSLTSLWLVDNQTWQIDVPLGMGAVSTVTIDPTQDGFGRAAALAITTDEPYEFTAPPHPSPASLTFAATHDDVGVGMPSVYTIPGGLSVTVRHRLDGQVSGVRAVQGAAVRFDSELSYDDDGRPSSVTRLDGSSSTWTYTATGVIDTITHKQGTTTKLALNYDYDSRDLPIKRTETAATTTVTNWTYDLEGRLLREKKTAGVSVVFDEIVTYDSAGNLRTRKRDAAGQPSATYTYKYDFDAPLVHGTHNNRLVSVEKYGSTGTLLSTVFLRYDNPFGHVSHLIRVPAGSSAIQATRLEYGAEGSPWLAWEESWTASPGGPTNVVRTNVIETRQFEGVGRLWRKLNPSTFLPIGTPRWSFEFGPVRAEYSISTVTGSVTWLALEVADTRVDAGSTQHSMTDMIGSTRLIASAGTYTAQDFTAWGERLSGPSTWPDEGFCGGLGVRQAFDGSSLTASKLNVMGYRLYSPELGRFVMRDPIGILGGANVYAYAGNQPSALTDASGLAPQGLAPIVNVRNKRPLPPGFIGPVGSPPPWRWPLGPQVITQPAAPFQEFLWTQGIELMHPHGPPLRDPKNPRDPRFVGPRERFWDSTNTRPTSRTRYRMH